MSSLCYSMYRNGKLTAKPVVISTVIFGGFSILLDYSNHKEWSIDKDGKYNKFIETTMSYYDFVQFCLYYETTLQMSETKMNFNTAYFMLIICKLQKCSSGIRRGFDSDILQSMNISNYFIYSS